MIEYVYQKIVNGVIKPTGIYNTYDTAKFDLELDIAFYESMCRDLNFKFEFVEETPKSFTDAHGTCMKEYKFIHNAITEHIIFEIDPVQRKDDAAVDENTNEPDCYIVTCGKKEIGMNHANATGPIDSGIKFESIESAREYIYSKATEIDQDFKKNKSEFKKTKYDSVDGSHFLIAYTDDKGTNIYYDFDIIPKY